MRPVVIIAASACALAGAGLAGLVWLRPTPQPVALPRAAEAKPFSMEQFRKDSRNQMYSTWAEQARQAMKDCPKCQPPPLPDITREEPAFEDVAPPKQSLPSHGRAAPRTVPPMPPVKQLPPHLQPYVSPFVQPQPRQKPKPKGWDI